MGAQKVAQYIDPSYAYSGPDLVLIVATAFIVVVALGHLANAVHSGALRAPLCARRSASALMAMLDRALQSPTEMHVAPLACGTPLWVCYPFNSTGEGEQRHHNWAIRVRSHPTLYGPSRVLGHVHMGQMVIATGRTSREFAEVEWDEDGRSTGWVAMYWEGQQILSTSRG
eukprot:SAG11_NODE_2276_length_3583_cov_2.156429_4_plen_171_part_00